MSFFKIKRGIYPLVAIVASLFLLVFGLVTAKSERCSYFLLCAYAWLFIFGLYKGCLRILPAFIIIGGAFAGIFYAVTDSPLSALSMANRFGSLFLAAAIGMSVESVALTRNLSQLRAPRAITLGMLISTSFVPVLRGEIKRIREAVKTRGAGSVYNPKVWYRAFLIPLVMRLVKISDTLSLSVETRGFSLGKEKYSVYKNEIFSWTDLLFIAGLTVGGVLAVVL